MTNEDFEDLNGEGTCLDTAKPRPSYRFKAYKWSKKRCAEMEEFKQLVDQKKLFTLSKDELEKILKD